MEIGKFFKFQPLHQLIFMSVLLKIFLSAPLQVKMYAGAQRDPVFDSYPIDKRCLFPMYQAMIKMKMMLNFDYRMCKAMEQGKNKIELKGKNFKGKSFTNII